MRTIRFLASLAGLRLDQVAFWSKGDLPQSSNRYMSEERHGSYEGLLDLLQRPSHALNGHEAEIVSVVANALPRLVSPVQRHNAERVLASKRASRGECRTALQAQGCHPVRSRRPRERISAICQQLQTGQWVPSACRPEWEGHLMIRHRTTLIGRSLQTKIHHSRRRCFRQR